MSDDQRLSMWVVYDHPLDFPDHYVAREHVIDKGGARPTESLIQSEDLDAIRRTMLVDMGLTCITRFPEDDPKIVEAWV